MLLRFLLLSLLFPFCFGDEIEELAERGLFAEAGKGYGVKGELNLEEGRFEEAFKCFFNASMCYKMSGDLGLAERELERARKLRSGDEEAEMRMDAQEGSIKALGKKPLSAIASLERAEKLAKKSGASGLLADIYNDMGICLVSGGQYGRAMPWFVTANEYAVKTGQEGLAIRTLHNHLIASYQAWRNLADEIGRIEEVDGFVSESQHEELQGRVRAFESGFEHGIEILDRSSSSYLGVLFAQSAGIAAWRYGWKERGFLAVRGALESSRELADRSLERDCLLTMIEFYLDQSRAGECGILLDEYDAIEGEGDGVQRAQEGLLRARYLIDIGAEEERVKRGLAQAVEAVEKIRSDLARSQKISDLGRSFRERAGSPYLLLADLYLSQKNPSDGDLRAAREAVEAFKSWELEDFYRDDCVNLSLQNQRNLDDLKDGTVGVIYVIPLAERTEILLGTVNGMKRWSSRMNGDSIYRLARVFRHQLEADYGTPRYQDTSRKLFEELMRPGLSILRSEGVKHLVFVPDGPLGNIPLGALYDGESRRFLIEDFSISVSPGLSLTSGQGRSSVAPLAVLAACRVFGSDFSELPGVRKEVEGLQKLYVRNSPLLDEDFQVSALTQAISNPEVSVVHIATHGEFKGAAGETFLLASGGEKVSLDQLELMIRPKKYRGTPLDLLCLSACRTAAGDDQSALGFAGTAVKSGSRSVVATLWYIDDGAASEIVTMFHRYYLDGDSKARALQKAQLRYLKAERVEGNRHPHFWAPFVLIGEWN